MRYFLIDKVTKLEAGVSIRGLKNITLSDEILHDHFPDYPVMPGALILEAASQLAGFLIEVTVNQDESGLPRRALLAQVDKAKFRETAGPGDRLDIVVKLSSLMGTAAQVKAVVSVDEKRIATATLTFLLRRIESERVHEQRRYLYRLWTRDLEGEVCIP